jgi:hypothetical protein
MKYILQTIACILFTSLTACTGAPKMLDNATQPHALYIIVERNPRLPAEFLSSLEQTSQQRLPNTQIKIDDGVVDDQVLASADWLLVMRATRIKPDYFFKPSDNSTINGITDCLAGSSFGPGVIITPCVYATDSDYLEASIRDNHSKTIKTYTAQQNDAGWIWVLPFSAIWDMLTGNTQQQIWQDKINSLYDKMLNDDLFNNEMPVATSKE